MSVKDVAVLHVAAILDEDIKEERIQAWGGPFNWNDILAIMRRHYPTHKVVDDFPKPVGISTTADDKVPLKLLKKWAQQDGWKSLEDAIRETISSFQ